MSAQNNPPPEKALDTPANDNSGTDSPSEVELEQDIVNEKSLLRKLDLKLLPAVGILYLLSFLDRSNVGNARIEGLTTDLNMSGNQYLTGLTLYFIGYVLFEIPCNIILKRTTPRFWLPTLTIAWGIVATLMGIVTNMAGFFVARFFLGVTESGLFPGVVYYFSMWYKRRERQFRISLFFSAASLAGAFGGILAWGIGHMRVVWNNGWRWIFILEGIATVVIAVGAYWFIQNYPDTAKFVSEQERRFIRARLASDSDATHNEKFSWSNVMDAIKDPKCWLYGLGFHTMSLPLYTFSLFIPTIIKNLGYTAAVAQLLTIPPYAVAFVTTLTVAIYSERTGRRAFFIMGSSAVAAIGYIILLANSDPVGKPGVSYLGTFFAAAGIYPATALVLSWPAINVSGQTKRAVGNAMQITIGNLGAVLGTQLYRANDGPRYIVGHSFALGYLLANIIVCGILYLVLKGENKRREAIAPEVQAIGDLEDWPVLIHIPASPRTEEALAKDELAERPGALLQAGVSTNLHEKSKLARLGSREHLYMATIDELSVKNEKRMPFAGVHDSGEERDDSKLRESERHDARRKASNGPEYRSGLLLECKALRFDIDVLSRTLRHLCSMGYLKEVNSDEYDGTNFTKSLSLPIIAGGYPCLVESCWPTFSNFPFYLKKHDWSIPPDPRDGPMQDVIGKDNNFFKHMMTNHPAGEFQNHMAGYRQGRPSWMDDGFFPVSERLVKDADNSPEATFLVDIGGSIGHDLDEFCRKHPTAPGRHVLQDLEYVLSQIQKVDPKIEPMSYDFHTEQPIKGARAYYMHSVLHDWTDDVCESILSRVTAAMKPGYSKLLINENVIPSIGADWQATALDMMMMTLFSSRERTEEQWRKLLEPAGLRIIKIWSAGEGVESLIECELA
ncbi:major facilitator superfamily transporter [Colletotrichum fioriniae PJ7]|uniref:Major facilitator superfamily transporter n=1 Tax=Colletotrichum fioriniae PJ7 TaxID=1445577 RepID=A0A010R5H0_9PEZI|nr:major facilitator superfamily transporter [Colletotrichum fioriniae PJ7]